MLLMSMLGLGLVIGITLYDRYNERTLVNAFREGNKPED
jgi:hypothetical protein